MTTSETIDLPACGVRVEIDTTVKKKAISLENFRSLPNFHTTSCYQFEFITNSHMDPELAKLVKKDLETLSFLLGKYEHDLVKRELNMVFYETEESSAMEGLNHLKTYGGLAIVLHYYNQSGDPISDQEFTECKLLKAKISEDPSCESIAKVYCRFSYSDINFEP